MKNYHLESVGKLSEHPDEPDGWLISEAIQVSFFDGKALEFTISCYLEDKKDFLIKADAAIQDFLDKSEKDKSKFSNPVFQNYKHTKDYYDSQPQINFSALKLNDESEIWKYVYPHQIIVCEGDGEDNNIYLIFICECEWEEEHGLQIVFKNGEELTRVSNIDYAPTE